MLLFFTWSSKLEISYTYHTNTNSMNDTLKLCYKFSQQPNSVYIF